MAMFNLGERTEVESIAPSKRRPDCALVGVSRNKEDKSMVFSFIEKSTKAKLDHREFVPKKMETMTDEEFKKSTNLNVSRISHICRAFVTEEEFNTVRVENDSDNPAYFADNWLSITDQIGKLLMTKIRAGQDMTCELKVVYSENKGKWYSALPKVPAFISTVNHPKEFKYDPNYDKFEIPLNTPSGGGIPNQGAPAGAGTPAGQPTGNAFAGVSSGVPSGDSDF